MGSVLITPMPTCRYKGAVDSVGGIVSVENSRKGLEVGSYSIGGVVAWMSDRDSNKNQDDDESPLKRLSHFLASSTAAEDADPDEVEARLRNMSHGTNGD